MFMCPECRTLLARQKGAGGVYWSCPGCRGSHVGLAVLRRHHAGAAITELWKTFKAAGGAAKSEGRGCPTCARPMRELAAPVGEGEAPLMLDVCGGCQFVWFDANERERLTAKETQEEVTPGAPPERPRPGAKDTGWASAVGNTLTSRGTRSMDVSHDLSTVGTLLSFFAPVEDTHPTVHKPVATLSVLVLVVAASLLAFQSLDSAIATFGFIPAEWSRGGGMTLLTSFFIHAGWFHLLGNAYFLWMTGDNVEDFLGPVRFLVLLVVATVVGAAAHGVFDPVPDRPCVGASGGISGLMAFYALRFPRAKLYWRFMWMWVFRLPFWAWFFLWVFVQLLGAFEQLAGISAISSAAHLGGALVGLVFFLVWRKGRLAL